MHCSSWIIIILQVVIVVVCVNFRSSIKLRQNVLMLRIRCGWTSVITIIITLKIFRRDVDDFLLVLVEKGGSSVLEDKQLRPQQSSAFEPELKIFSGNDADDGSLAFNVVDVAEQGAKNGPFGLALLNSKTPALALTLRDKHDLVSCCVSNDIAHRPVTQQTSRDVRANRVLIKISRVSDIFVVTVIVSEKLLPEELARVCSVRFTDSVLVVLRHAKRFLLNEFLLKLLRALHDRRVGVRPDALKISRASQSKRDLAIESVDCGEGKIRLLDSPHLLCFDAELAPRRRGAVEGLRGDVRELDDIAGFGEGGRGSISDSIAFLLLVRG